jgi:hypothetical protein
MLVQLGMSVEMLYQAIIWISLWQESSARLSTVTATLLRRAHPSSSILSMTVSL